MKAKLVKESLNEQNIYSEEDIYNKDHIWDKDLNERKIYNVYLSLKKQGYDVIFDLFETHAGIDHYVINATNGDDLYLGWMPDGYMEMISDSTDWGWYVNDLDKDEYESFGNNLTSALSMFKELYSK